LDQVKMERTITSRRKLECRVYKFRICIEYSLVLIDKAYTHMHTKV